MDRGNGVQEVGTAQRAGGEVRIEQTSGAMTPNPAILRIRYYRQ